MGDRDRDAAHKTEALKLYYYVKHMSFVCLRYMVVCSVFSIHVEGKMIASEHDICVLCWLPWIESIFEINKERKINIRLIPQDMRCQWIAAPEYIDLFFGWIYALVRFFFIHFIIPKMKTEYIPFMHMSWAYKHIWDSTYEMRTEFINRFLRCNER